jgi:hypothetical protein
MVGKGKKKKGAKDSHENEMNGVSMAKTKSL